MFSNLRAFKMGSAIPWGRWNWFVIFVVIPTLFSAAYFGLFASEIYTSRSNFVIKSVGQKIPQSSSIFSLLQGGSVSPAREQAYEVDTYLHSRSALQAVQKRLNLRSIYSSPKADFFARYPGPLHADLAENLFDYYNDMTSIHLDSDTGIITLETRAFEAREAQAINSVLLDLGEQLVNRLNDRAQSQAVSENSKRVAAAELRMRSAREALSAYRNRTALIDPAKQASGDLEIANQLVITKTNLDAQLALMRRVTPSNPAIPALQSRSDVLAGQIVAQQGKVVGGGRGNIARKLGNYENLLVEQEFATQALAAAKTALEQSSSEAAKQQFYLERVVEPSVPDMARLPKRWRAILTVAAALTFLYLIGWMFIVGILEHAPD